MKFPQPDHISRRNFLQASAVLAINTAASQWASALPQPKPGAILAYVGTYTPNGQGIYLFQLNPSSGALTPVKVFPTSTNPTWLAFDPQNKYLYAANEISNFNGGPTGSVSAFAVASDGDLTFLNTVASAGAAPVHLSVHPSGKYLLVANYGGNVAVIRILANGTLGSVSDVQEDAKVCDPATCPVGPPHAAMAPPSSFANSGHDAAHAHMIQSDPSGRFVFVNDLGLDRTLIWKFDAASGKLSSPKTFPSSPGSGPRHFLFHPNGRWFYSLNEESSTLAFLIYDPAAGSLQPIQEISGLPAGFTGTSYASGLILSKDGKLLYAANRLHDSISIFSIDNAGRPTLIAEEFTRGDYPRSLNIEPNGEFLYV